MRTHRSPKKKKHSENTTLWIFLEGKTLDLSVLSRNSGSLIQRWRIFFFFWGAVGGDTQALRVELRTSSDYITDLSRSVPDVTCSLTNFWPLHHSFKIAKSDQRNFILRTVTSAAGQMMEELISAAITPHFFLKKNNSKHESQCKVELVYGITSFFAAIFHV